MKKTTLAAMLLTCVLSYGQKHKKAAYLCGLGHKCETSMSYDEFNKSTLFSDSVRLTNLAHDRKSVTISKSVLGNSELFWLYFSTTSSGCLSRGAHVVLLFSSGETMDLNYQGQIDCGVYSIDVNLSKEQLEKISTEPLNKVRIAFTDNTDDFEVGDKSQVKLMEKAKCILEINKSIP